MFYKTSFVTNDAFIGVFVVGLDSAAIAIVEFQLRYGGSIGDMGDHLAIRLRSMRSNSKLFALLNGSPQIFVQASQPTAILGITEIS